MPGESHLNAYHRVGRVRALAVEVFCRGVGLDRMPYPFVATPAYDDTQADARDRAAIDHMLRTDPPRELTPWIKAIANADISMQLYATYPLDPDRRRTVRINGVRVRDQGFVAVQEPHDDSGRSTNINVYSIDATKLHVAMLELTPRIGSGRHGELVLKLPESPTFDRPVKLSSADLITEFDATPSEFSAFFQIQTGPSRDWGIDRNAQQVFWEHKQGDGRYLIDRAYGKRAIAADDAGLEQAVVRYIAQTVARIRRERAELR